MSPFANDVNGGVGLTALARSGVGGGRCQARVGALEEDAAELEEAEEDAAELEEDAAELEEDAA